MQESFFSTHHLSRSSEKFLFFWTRTVKLIHIWSVFLANVDRKSFGPFLFLTLERVPFYFSYILFSLLLVLTTFYESLNREGAYFFLDRQGRRFTKTCLVEKIIIGFGIFNNTENNRNNWSKLLLISKTRQY